MTLCASAGKSKITDLPTTIVVVNGENEFPGMNTVATVSLGVPFCAGPAASLLHAIIQKVEKTKVLMHITRATVLLVLAMVLSASKVDAQTCLGLTSFAVGKAHVNASVDLPDSATVIAGGLGAGTHNSIFATLGGGVVRFEGMNGTSRFGFLEFGYQLPLGKLQICPVGGGTFGTGPDDEFVKVTSRSASVGAAAGLPLGAGPVALIPNAGVHYIYFSDRVDEEGIGRETHTSNATVADLGLSLLLKSRVVLQPVVRVPITGGGNTNLGFFLSIGL